MTRDHSNPFVLPGFGQSGEFAANPVMASMEMMRQAWQSLAEQGGFGAPSMAATLSAEDLERRITDLRAVENWLRMNLTVLSSTIQGLEVQRATLSTFKQFVNNAAAAGQDASALERFFGVNPAKSADAKTTQRQTAANPAASRQPTSDQTESDPTTARQTADAARSAAFDADQAVAATQAWWDMLRKQFDSLAAATAASMPPATSPTEAAAPSATPRKSTPVKPSARKSSATSAKPAGAPRSRR